MSNANSGTSTPTPPPDPLTVGTRFVMQYYKILSTKPDMLIKFYQPTSYLSQGIGPQKALALQCKDQSVEDLKDRFYVAGVNRESPIRFELENGAIDAQLSVNGGVLLVVTGSLIYLDEDDKVEASVQRRKSFVHTFFLGSTAAGGKRSYYVHNDVLRFLHEDEEKTVVVSNKTKTETPAKKADSVPVLNDATAPRLSEVDEAPGGGVEESKEEALIGGALVAKKFLSNDAGTAKTLLDLQEDNQNKSGSDDEAVPVGSWASLVARSGGTVTPSPPTPVRVSKSETQPSPTVAAVEATVPAPARAPTRPAKRDPDCTLVVKNIVEGVSEADLLALFQGLISDEAKVLGSTVSPNKGIAFIDFDSPTPVLAIVAQHQASPFSLNDQALDVYQKTLENRSRGRNSGRGSFRGGSNNNSNGSYRGGGRGFRRGGRGGRGSGGRGR